MLIIKQKQKISKISRRIWMKPWLKTWSDKSACANIILKLLLTTNSSIIFRRIQKQLPEMFLKILQILQENTRVGVSQSSGSSTIKKRLLHRYLFVKFEKFFRTSILKKIWKTASVSWLLHHILIFTVHLRYTFFSFTNNFFKPCSDERQNGFKLFKTKTK